jgi:hypothetical protein
MERSMNARALRNSAMSYKTMEINPGNNGEHENESRGRKA